jgi:hypothetical protein
MRCFVGDAAFTWVCCVLAAAAIVCLPSQVFSQATQGMIYGRILDSTSGRPIGGAEVTYLHATTSTIVRAQSGVDGSYVLPLIPPGTLRMSASRSGYQSQHIFDLEIPVAGSIEISFRLRPLQDVWESGQYRSLQLPGNNTIVSFYGPDVDTSRSLSMEGRHWRSGVLESTLSYVVEPAQISDLPLSGRDAYTALVTLPGVTADTTTARSLGLAANGQRPSASNFLLDGLENNNNLVTGPLVSVAPEAIQEYRVSTNNYSAEYGGTSGYLANAVTRSGSNQWHGLGYMYAKNEALNANDFQDNLKGIDRQPAKEMQPGIFVGGPVRKNSILISASYEQFRSRGRANPTSYRLPTEQLFALTSSSSLARSLLIRFPAPSVSAGQSLYGVMSFSPPVSVDRWQALPRVDYTTKSGAHRFSGRVALARLSRPDFVWSPYRDFIAGFNQNDTSLAVSLTSILRPGMTNEARLGRSWGSMALRRPHPEIPALTTADSVTLPGSQIFSEFTNDTGNWEMLDNVLLVQGRHAWKLGGGALIRTLSGDLTAARDGLYYFNSISDFAKDRPSYFGVSLNRRDLPKFRLPRFDRRYRLNQFFVFLQDSYRAAPRLTLNYGVRYESHGAPQNVGEVKDALIELGQGNSLGAKLTTARMVYADSGDQSLYEADRNNWAARVGLAWNLTGNGRTVLRAGYGIFYDRPFDNVWQNLRNNNFLFPRGIPARNTNYLDPIASVLPLYEGSTLTASYRFVTLFQPNLRDAYAQSYFLGAQRQIGEAWFLETSTLGSLGRKLLTTDIVNRSRQFNPSLDELIYRGNQGISDYNALAVQLRHRGRRIQAQVSYTWSHSIDNMSELLSNDYFNLNPVRLTGPTLGEPSTFSRQFDSRGDRGNSAFDQRHNLVFFSTMELRPLFTGSRVAALFRGWKFSQLGAFRSGLPFTVFSPSAPYRADYVYPDLLKPTGNTDIAGGKQLLNPLAFARPKSGTGLLGTAGRNAFTGPGFYNIDISLARSFSLAFLGDGGRLTLRADAFNFLNHANLNLPNAVFPSSTFGAALYGRTGPQSGLPTLSPLNDTSRQIQLLLRVEF